MGKNRANRLLQRRKGVETIEASDLVIPGKLDAWKLDLPDRSNKAVVVFKDTDGTNLVVDGRHMAERAKRRNGKVKAVFVQEDEVLGKQTVLERLLGMLTKQQ